MKKQPPEKRGGGGGRGCSARLPTPGGAAASPSGPSRGARGAGGAPLKNPRGQRLGMGSPPLQSVLSTPGTALCQSAQLCAVLS